YSLEVRGGRGRIARGELSQSSELLENVALDREDGGSQRCVAEAVGRALGLALTESGTDGRAAGRRGRRTGVHIDDAERLRPDDVVIQFERISKNLDAVIAPPAEASG